MEDVKQSLMDVAKSQLPETFIMIAYMEHQLDLCSQLIVDIAEASGVTLSADAENRLSLLKDVLAQSSIDFANITGQLESYKIPNATSMKAFIHKIEDLYLQAQIREGTFGR